MIAKKSTYYTSRRILVTYFLVLILVPYLLLSGLQTMLYVRSIKNATVKASKETVEQINLSVEKQVNKIKSFITSLSSSEEYRNFLKDSHTGKYNYDLYESYNKLVNFISINTLDEFNIKSLVIVNQYNQVYTFGESGYFGFRDVEQSGWYRETVESNGKYRWFVDQVKGTGSEYSASLITTKKIYDILTLENLGVIYVEVLNDFLDINITDKTDNSLLYLVDENRIPLFTLTQSGGLHDKELIERLTQKVMEVNFNEHEICRLDGENYIPVVSAPSDSGWVVVKAIPIRQLTGAVIRVCIFSGLIMLCCFALFFGMFLVIYRRIAQPMKYLIGLVNEIKADPGIDIDLGKYPCYEAMQISSEIINLSKENETVNSELKEVSFDKKKAELDKLQAEINPHYIYNTLTAIKYMALQNNQKEISSMITALVKILRSTVNREGQFITVEEEIDNLEQYIYIQRILSKNKIEFVTDIDSEATKCFMPNFILQPLVENAVIHGLNPKGCEGRVNISVRVQNEMIVIEVTDDGIGVDMAKISEWNPSHAKGAGISNIALPGLMKKIELLYEGKGVFRIEPVAAGGTKVTVIFPMKFER